MRKSGHMKIFAATATATLVFQVEENGNINPVLTVNLGIDQLIFRKLSNIFTEETS